jgi:hypothetical protein
MQRRQRANSTIVSRSCMTFWTRCGIGGSRSTAEQYEQVRNGPSSYAE